MATIIGRTAVPALPSSGVATYSGDYIAVLVDTATQSFGGVVTGEADLVASFGAASQMSGTLSDRVVRSTGNPNIITQVLADIDLFGAPIDAQGEFSGNTENGGTYSGFLANGTGEDVMGRTEIPFGTGQVETGVFLTED